MNKLKAKIVRIDSSEDISLVDLKVKNDIFSCVVIETPQTANYLKIGNQVTILFKEAEVSIGKNLSGEISLRNRVKSTIKHIEKGEVLTRLVLDYEGIEIGSIITTRSANRMKLENGDEVVGLIKANEVSILEGE